MTPVDPMVRVHLWAEFLKREKKLVIALLLAVLVSLSAFLAATSDRQMPFTKSELEQMGNLPLAPEGAPPPGPTEADEKQLRELSEKLKQAESAP